MCPKAYRWVGEMEEISKTYKSLGMTGQIYSGMAELYQMVADSPLGKEIPEERKLGTTDSEVAETIIQFKNSKS